MNKIFRNTALMICAGIATVSCDYDETEYDSLINDFDPNSEFYIQFSNANKDLKSSVDEQGEVVDIETTVDVVILGPPQDQDVTVDLSIDPSSTMDPSMYTLSSEQIIISAGESSGSVTLTTNTEQMPFQEVLTLNMNLDAGDHNATSGTELSYDLMRMEFCPLEDGVLDLVGSYEVTEDFSTYENSFTAVENDGNLMLSGLGEKFITDFWFETVISSGTIRTEVTENGNVIIPRQYVFTTDYQGASYEYEIEGSGTWINCNESPIMELTYDIYYPGDAEGIAKQKSGDLPEPYLGGVFTMN